MDNLTSLPPPLSLQEKNIFLVLFFFNCVLATKSYYISQAILSPELPRAANMCLVYSFVLSRLLGNILVWNCLILIITVQSLYSFISYIHCQNVIRQKVTAFRDKKSLKNIVILSTTVYLSICVAFLNTFKAYNTMIWT